MNRQYQPAAGNGALTAGPIAPPPRKAGPVNLAASMRPAQAFAVIAHGCVQQLAANAAGALAADGQEHVHQMRVALRRLRSALRLFGDWLPLDFRERTGAELKWLGALLGEVRDYDVLLSETLPGLLRETPQSRAGAAEKRIAGAIAPRHDAAGARMRRALRSRRYRALLDDLAGTCLRLQQAPTPGVGSGRTLRDFAAGKLKHAQRRLRLPSGELARMPPEQRHQIRIAAKRLRYAVDFFSSLFGAGAARYAARLADLQDALGSLNDQSVAGRLVAGLDLTPRAQAAIRRRMEEQADTLLRHALRAHRRLLRQPSFWRKT
jgi:CHAD domain-containing protein